MSEQKSYEIYLYDNKKQNPQNKFCNEQFTKQDEVFKYKYLNLLIMGKSPDYIQQLHEDEQSAWQIQIESENNEDEQEYQENFYTQDYDHIIEDEKYLHKQGHKKIYQKEIHPLKCKQNGESSFSFQLQTQSYKDQDASPLETLGDIGNYDQNNSQKNLYKQNQKNSQEKYSNAQQLRSKQKKLTITSFRKMILQQQSYDNSDVFENSILQKHRKHTIFDLSNLQNQDEIQITDNVQSFNNLKMIESFEKSNTDQKHYNSNKTSLSQLSSRILDTQSPIKNRKKDILQTDENEKNSEKLEYNQNQQQDINTFLIEQQKDNTQQEIQDSNIFYNKKQDISEQKLYKNKENYKKKQLTLNLGEDFINNGRNNLIMQKQKNQTKFKNESQVSGKSLEVQNKLQTQSNKNLVYQQTDEINDYVQTIWDQQQTPEVFNNVQCIDLEQYSFENQLDKIKQEDY